MNRNAADGLFTKPSKVDENAVQPVFISAEAIDASSCQRNFRALHLLFH
jgi:hypothetical protein